MVEITYKIHIQSNVMVEITYKIGGTPAYGVAKHILILKGVRHWQRIT